MRFGVRLLTAGIVFATLAAAGPLGNVGVWTGSNRSWTDPSVSNLQNWLTDFGYSLTPTANAPDSSMLAFVISETSEVPTFIPALINWVQLGGKLFLLTDFGVNTKAINYTTCLTTGGAMSITGCATPYIPTNPPQLNSASANVDKSQVTTKPNYDVATIDNGKQVKTSLGYQINGGSPIVGTYAKFLPLGAGYVYVFGDRLDNNALVGAAPLLASAVNQITPSTDPNAGLILALLATDVPEPATLSLIPLALAALAALKLRR